MLHDLYDPTSRCEAQPDGLLCRSMISLTSHFITLEIKGYYPALGPMKHSFAALVITASGWWARIRISQWSYTDSFDRDMGARGLSATTSPRVPYSVCPLCANECHQCNMPQSIDCFLVGSSHQQACMTYGPSTLALLFNEQLSVTTVRLLGSGPSQASQAGLYEFIPGATKMCHRCNCICCEDYHLEL